MNITPLTSAATGLGMLLFVAQFLDFLSTTMAMVQCSSATVVVLSGMAPGVL